MKYEVIQTVCAIVTTALGLVQFWLSLRPPHHRIPYAPAPQHPDGNIGRHEEGEPG